VTADLRDKKEASKNIVLDLRLKDFTLLKFKERVLDLMEEGQNLLL
jgi:hypothetical protein